MNIKTDRTMRSMVTIANATELTKRVIKNIAGNNMSMRIHGENLSNEVLNMFITSYFRTHLQRSK